MFFFENCDFKSGHTVCKLDNFGMKPYSLISFSYNLASMANSINPRSGSREQPILRSSPRMGIPKAATFRAAQVLNDLDEKACDEYKSRRNPCIVVCIREMHGSQRSTDVKL